MAYTDGNEIHIVLVIISMLSAFAFGIPILISQFVCNLRIRNNILSYTFLAVVFKILIGMIIVPIIFLETGKTGRLAKDYI